MTRTDEWEMFQSFADRGPAEALCVQLELEQVPCRIEPRALENAVEAVFCVMVARSLAHRARWVVGQLPPTEEELIFLATGKLPGQE
jgi:hypothetical protein